ncbi:MAG: hypothetical protein LBU88_04385 [Treponema sp.]|nr:hypothetical protein [Treponema sp.]
MYVGGLAGKLKDYIDEYTIGVVAVLGIMYTGLYDDVNTVNRIVGEYNKKGKNEVYIHVDAAAGGLLEPFINQASCDTDIKRQPRLPLICWKLSDEVEKIINWNVNDFADRLMIRGWQIPVYPLSADLQNVFVQRIVCRADMSVELVKILVQDMKNAVKYLEHRFFTTNVKRENEAFGFTH